jgi:hypothetical protein
VAVNENNVESTADGRALIWIFTPADRNLFRRCSDCLANELGAQPTERFDAMDQIFLDLVLAGIPIVLQWTDGRGVAVSVRRDVPGGEAFLGRIANFVSQRVTA